MVSDFSVSSDSSQQRLAARYPNRSPAWQLRTRQLELPARPLIMGVVNVTPDSFSDGGKFHATESAISHALQLAADGADILDIGGESTRPYSDPISLAEELSRVADVVREVCRQTKIPVSIDTSKSKVAAAAIEAGAEIINDVTGLEGDSDMFGVASQSQAGLCVMHMQGNPQTMQDDPTYKDVVQDILGYLKSRFESLVSAGIEPAKICLDPGIGFGKTHEHNITLMANCGAFHELGQPLLVGHSRKGFLAKIIGDQVADRTAATVGASMTLAMQGIQVIRVHDVRPVREALIAFDVTGGLS